MKSLDMAISESFVDRCSAAHHTNSEVTQWTKLAVSRRLVCAVSFEKGRRLRSSPHLRRANRIRLRLTALNEALCDYLSPAPSSGAFCLHRRLRSAPFCFSLHLMTTRSQNVKEAWQIFQLRRSGKCRWPTSACRDLNYSRVPHKRTGSGLAFFRPDACSGGGRASVGR